MKDSITKAISTNTGTSEACNLAYVLITAARDEAEFIEQTIKSVAAQTVLPVRWVIVSDGSTDGTDDIVKKYIVEHKWIELVRMPERTERHFAGKAHAFNSGYVKVKSLNWDIIGNLDADISFDECFFEFLIGKFTMNPKLGVAGARFIEDGTGYDFRFASVEHVSGQCQLFRRNCYESIGGYLPVKRGGIDLIAVLTARMQGWETRTFKEKYFLHHRPMGTAEGGALKAWFKDGQKDYSLGTHPFWEISRVAYQVSRKPIFIGGCALFCGYFWSILRNIDRSVSCELVRFRRKDQMRRLRKIIESGILLRKKV